MEKLQPQEHVKEIQKLAMSKIKRRELLKLLPIGAASISLPLFNESLIKQGLSFSDWVSETLYNPNQLAEVFTDSQVTEFKKFPYNTYDKDDPEVDLENWRLSVEGLVEKAGDYKLEQIQALPKYTQNVRHICIEGWDVIGNFAGAKLADFLKMIGADSKARFVEVICADYYYSSYDMASCLHPQTLLCYEMYGKPLDRGHGAPLRIHMPTKLGYKSCKYLISLRVSNILSKDKGFWEDQGYSWFAGI
ncbi:MAG: molybdopterin-dependent oxidoreductase [Acidobacteria bacterium]|nr:molybdopterin-dependent oxidoreductase [Acidobacteriota bacterium]